MIKHIAIYIVLCLVIALLCFALANIQSERPLIEEKDAIISEQQRKLDTLKLHYAEVLKVKNDTIGKLKWQVDLLNNYVARRHGRPPESFTPENEK